MISMCLLYLSECELHSKSIYSQTERLQRLSCVLRKCVASVSFCSRLWYCQICQQTGVNSIGNTLCERLERIKGSRQKSRSGSLVHLQSFILHKHFCVGLVYFEGHRTSTATYWRFRICGKHFQALISLPKTLHSLIARHIDLQLSQLRIPHL